MVQSLQLEDAHWRWGKKAVSFYSPEYTWFFLDIGDVAQAACLTYHPKPSAIDGEKIYYIEYIAVAPWNRPNPIGRRYIGLGRVLVAEVNKYMKSGGFGIRPGFGLHSLPGAEGFYRKIGMMAYSTLDKDGLTYFEMPAPAVV